MGTRAMGIAALLVGSVVAAGCEIKTASAPSARPAAGKTAPSASASAEPASSTSPVPAKVE